MDFSYLEFEVYKSKMTSLFVELVEFKLNYDGKLEVDDFNMFSKVMVNYFNTGVFNEFIGGKYKLCKLNDKEHYTMYDTNSGSPLNNMYIFDDTYEAIEKKQGAHYVEQMRQFIMDVESSIYEKDDNYIQKRLKYQKNVTVVDYSMNEDDLKFQESFYKSDVGSHYNVNFKTQTIKTLIQDKLNMDTPIQAVFFNNFAEHYAAIKQTLPYEFYPEFKDTQHAFDKQCHFMHDELDLLYIPPKNDHFEHSRNIDHTWVLLHQNNRYAGGAIISRAEVNEIRHISLKSSIANKDNCKKVLDDILASEYCSHSVFITAPEIQQYGLQHTLRDQYKNRPLYFTDAEKDAYFTLEAFIELNHLGSQGDKIKNDFYKNIIVKHEKAINQHDLFKNDYESQTVLELLMDKFKVDTLKKYSQSANDLEVVDRETFIRRCFVSQEGENGYKYYLKNDYHGVDFAFRIPLDGNGTTDLLNVVKDFLLNQNIAYTQDVYKGVYESIQKNEQIATHESTQKEFLTYNYHSLYETLSDLGCITTNKEPCFVFRLEMADGQGMYTSSVSDDNIIKTNEANILNYDQRRVPARDSGLSTLFLASDSRHEIANNYADNYNFAFTSKEQMLDWFGKHELDLLSNAGAKLYRCEIPHVNMIASQVQVAFNKNKLISKTELKLNEFLNMETEKKPLRNNKIKM